MHGKLMVQPLHILAAVLQITRQDLPVQDHGDLGAVRLGLHVEIRRGHGPCIRLGQEGQPAVCLHDDQLQAIQIVVAAGAALGEKFAQIHPGTLQVVPVQLAVVVKNEGAPLQKAPGRQPPVGGKIAEHCCQGVDAHSQQGLKKVAFQRSRHFGSNGADGDAVDIVEQVQLGHLLVADELGQQKQGDDGADGGCGHVQ